MLIDIKQIYIKYLINCLCNKFFKLSEDFGHLIL